MTDEDDERMDRAKRIRELREGRRVADPDDDSGPDDGSTAAEGDDESTSSSDERTESEATETDEDPTTESGADSPDDAAATTKQTTDTDDGADTQAATEESDDSGEDAAAAVAQAAEAASEFEGSGVAMELEADDDAPETDDATQDDGAGPMEMEEDSVEETRVLEFRLGDELYCLDIEYVEEIVHEETVTRVPNTPEHVSGVVDLRGQITTILDPKTVIGLESAIDDADRLIVVFDADAFEEHGAIGWLVDEVNQVTPITDEEVKDSPIEEPYINGIIERGDAFVIWTTPELTFGLDEE